MNDFYVWMVIAVIALVTATLRFLPFVVFGSDKKTPRIIEKLGKVLPYSIMGMLVVYCLKDVTFGEVSGYLPALIAGAVVCILYIWKRNTLLSILCGTICYMFLVQKIF